MRRYLATTVTVLLLLFAAAVPAAYAELARVGPVGFGGYPTWYQDKTGLALEFCSPLNASELNGGWCLLLAGDTTAPEAFPSPFSEEHFYWAADAGAGDFRLVLAHEGAFAVGPVVQGDQIVFGRLRIVNRNVLIAGTYTVYTPFGRFAFPNQAAGERLFFTSDVGLQCPPGNFECSLATQSGPFLLPSRAPGGGPACAGQPVPCGEVPPIPDLVYGSGVDPFYDATIPFTPYPVTGKKYIADPARLGPVTGGYCIPDGTTCVIGNLPGEDPLVTPTRPLWNTRVGLRDPNIFLVEGPVGSNLDGAGNDFVETVDFALMGRIFEGPIAGKVNVDRASYARSATAPNKIDVYATAFPSTIGRIPGNPIPVAVPTVLSFYDAACATDPVTGAVTGPPTGFSANQMFQAGSNYFAESNPLAIPANPAQVCVQANATNAAGQTTITYIPTALGDQIFITEALFDPANHALSVKATSSDEVVPPTLTVAGFGAIDPLTGQAFVPALNAPPSEVTVSSSAGGLNRMQVSTGPIAGLGGGGGTLAPVAVNDDSQFFEDCSPTASITVCATPVVINVLANDLNAVGGTVAILPPGPLLGTATVNGDGTISYTPKLNANMMDTFQYTVTVGTQTSAAALVTIYILPVNDLPVAVNDTIFAANNQAITFNLLANDTDPDGTADLANAVIVTGNAALGIAAGTAAVGGSVTFIPTGGAGTQTFTYQAQDQAGALSANTATVTVNVNAAENIVINKAQYTVRQNRWVVSGTDSVPGGQTLSIRYADGSLAGFEIGTATVLPDRTWALDRPGVTGNYDPRTSGATRLTIISPFGGTATVNFKLK